MTPPEMARTESKLNILKQKIKEHCMKEEVLNPAMAFEIMNQAQRAEDPEAYEPDIVVQYRNKKEMQRIKNEELKRRDALFDFDDSLDNLSEVSERYPVIMF